MKIIEANGAAIPALGMGTWTLKGEQCAELVAEALRAGYRHLDTAALYDNEVAVGEGIRRSGVPRDEIFLTTKVWHTDIADGDLQASAAASLDRLGVQQVDLLLIHWPSHHIDTAEAVRALNDAAARGLARHIGVSNFTTRHLATALAASERRLVCNQIEYHPLLDQQKVMASCADSGMAVVSYCPLARGGSLFQNEAVLKPARRLAATPAQIVLAWHLAQDGVAAIPRSSNPDRLRENLDAAMLELADEEVQAISALSTAGKRLCDYDFSPAWD